MTDSTCFPFSIRSFAKIVLVQLFILVFLPSALLGQREINYSSLNESNGLPTSNVFSIIQDTAGTLWLGTDLGLVRYNGLDADLIVPENGTSLVVLKLFKDYKHRIWLSTYHDGIYYIENDSLKEPAFNQSLIAQQKLNAVIYARDLFLDEDDRLYFTMHSGSNYYYSAHLDSSTFKAHLIPEIERSEIFYLTDSTDFRLSGKYIGGGPPQKEVEELRRPKLWHRKIYSELGYQNYGVDHLSKIVWSGNHVYFPEDGRDSISLEFRINDVQKIREDLLISTDKGLFRYIKDKGEYIFANHYFSEIIVSKVFQDAEGVLWVTTVGEGCIKVNSFAEEKLKLPLITKTISNYSEMFVDKDTFCLFDNNILLKVDLNQNKIIEQVKLSDRNDHFLSISKYRAGSIIYVNRRIRKTRKHDVKMYLHKAGKSSVYMTFSRARTISGIKQNDVTVDSFGRIFWLSSRGFIMMDDERNIFDSYSNGFLEDISCVISSSEEINYLGGPSGLFQFNPLEGSFEQLFPEKINSPVNTLSLDRFDNLYLGMKGGGLGIISNGEFYKAELRSGYSDNFIRQLESWGQNIWLRTAKEIYVLNDFDSTGISGLRVPAYTLDKATIYSMVFTDENPFVVSKDGLLSLDTRVFAYPFSNAFKLKQTSINNFPRKVSDLENGSLAYDENNVSAEIQLRTLHSNADNRIRYRLVGKDSVWTESSSKIINYLSLAPGAYQLEVAAENAIGQWSKTQEVLSFKIRLPFYKTWWFATSVIAAVLSLAWLTYFLGTRSSEREKQLLLANITSLKRQINPHFVLNALSSIRYYQRENDLKKADSYITRLADLFSNIVYSSDNKRVLLSDELERIKNYVALESTRFEGKLNFDLQVAESVVANRLFLPPMLLQPLIENALEHGLKGVEKPKLSVRVELNSGILLITIQDNGLGIKEEVLRKLNTQKSVGLSNVMKRVELIRQLEGKELSIHLQNDNGLKIQLRIEQ